MSSKKRSSETTKEKILSAARVLFARNGIAGTSIRSIAQDAGINHTLIIQYFGSKEKLATEILRREISHYTMITAIEPGKDAPEVIAAMRQNLLHLMTDPDTKTVVQLIMRAEMDGMAPERMIDESSGRVINTLSNFIRSNQKSANTQDASLSSIVILGAIASLITISPWLLSAAGIPEKDFEKSKEEIADILIGLIIRMTGFQPEAVRIDHESHMP